VTLQIVASLTIVMEQNTYLNTNIYSYLETSGGQSSNLRSNVVHFFTPVLIRHLWQLKTVFFLHWCLICPVLLTTLAKAKAKIWSITYDHNRSFKILATVITIINYDRKTFIVQATGVNIIKLFTMVISCHFMVMSTFCVIKLHYHGNCLGMAVYYQGKKLYNIGPWWQTYKPQYFTVKF
jgi:hypothetical protein